MDKKSFIVCIIGLGLLIVLIIWRNMNQNDLKNDGVIVEAQIIRVNLGGRTSGGFQCLITYKGEEKELSSPSTLVKGSFDFIGKTFPAMYLPDKDILEILITPRDFEKFNIPFPDSLNWVMPYVLKQ
jgi:hypothetical protein